MSPHKKLLKAIQNLFREMVQIAKAVTKKLMNWLLRSILVTGRKANLANAGFILPTVTMVILVVILLTTAMLFRSFERSKNASNVRVSQAVLAAAGPGVERAKAKIQQLLADPTLPRSTPTDVALYTAVTGNLPGYTLGDEQPLKVVNDFDQSGGIQSLDNGGAASLEKDESNTTAWRFPVDTDNNGSFDSYTLYGIYFRTPSAIANRPRSSVESRTPPMSSTSGGDACRTADAGSTSASLVGNTGWYKTPQGNLEKSFFVFSTTVPITPPPGVATTTTPPGGTTFEYYTGNRGFSAIEYQQDQARIPLTNNAVVYDDDLEITPGSPLRINGRIMTNGNLITGSRGGNANIEYYQVSSKSSCFYKEENGKINVGGNLLVGSAENATAATGNVRVHLYEAGEVPDNATLGTNNKSVTNTAPQASYNSQAYARRIDDLVQRTVTLALPPELQKKVNNGADRNKALQDYFKERTRRVPFAEVATNASSAQTVAGGGVQDQTTEKMRPVDSWSYPVIPNATTGATDGSSTNSLSLQRNQPPAKNPATRNGKEFLLGDRILVGNGLPAKWWDKKNLEFVDFYSQTPQPVGANTTWDGGSDEPRTRMTQVVPLSDLGETDRDGFWERHAARKPDQALDGWGGLRVVTGAGVYNPSGDSFLPKPTSPIDDNTSTREDESQRDNLGTLPVEGFTVVLPDSMPMWEDTDTNGNPSLPPDTVPFNAANQDKRGDLVMRATAVYHYRASDYPYTANYPNRAGANQTPIACVSSYYNPTTNLTARNRAGLPWSGSAEVASSGDGLSNNGISYPRPTITSIGIAAGGQNAAGVFINPAPAFGGANWRARLNFQANMIFPDGRFVNPQLRQALKRLDGQLGGVPRLTLAEQSAIDSTLCALQIADGTLAAPNSSVIPHGAIYETAFLDARQVKAVEGTDATLNNYDLSIEERQPLEIRATVLNLDALRRTAIAGAGTQPVPAPEYLLPDSGIIYATRDDALLDMSAPGDTPPPLTSPTTQIEENRRIGTQKINSPVDFELDPSRRPNGIMLTDGSVLARGGNANTYKQTEKGLILATNLPVYVKADDDGTNSFNRHQSPGGQLLEEFVEKLAVIGNWNKNQFYNRSILEPNFACRKNQPGINCTVSDLWRPATVLADSVTLLSNNFRFGFRNQGDYDLRKNVDNKAKNLVLGGYDFDGSGGIGANIVNIGNELNFRIDVNKDGDFSDPIAIAENTITTTLARRFNGFFDNNYLTSANWFDTITNFPKDLDTTASGQQGSSYVNNFVTPIQRRTTFPEYVMEICRKPLVSQCQPSDWKVYVGGIAKDSSNLLDTTVAQLQGPATGLGAGTTAKFPLNPAEERYPRRVAFLRNSSHKLVLDSTDRPYPLGISSGKVKYYSYGAAGTVNVDGNTVTVLGGGAVPDTQANALWFRTTNTPATPTAGENYGNNRPLFYQTPLVAGGTTQQPLLVPVLQIHTPTGTPANSANVPSTGSGEQQNWMQTPIADADAAFNLIIAAGDNPTRDATGTTPAEFNGGLPNFVMFLENWNNSSTPSTARISGSFIQFKRSAYATAPFLSVLTANPTPAGIFNYPQLYRISNNSPAGFTDWGRTPYYSAPRREWGFDVGLLSQLPDLFSQQITTPAVGEPNEFYREVGRDDPWVRTLLCAAVGQRVGATTTYNYRNAYAVTDTGTKPDSSCLDLNNY